MAAPVNITATSLEQQAYLVALELQKLELAIAPENRPDRTQISFDTEGNTVAISITLDTTFAITDGKAVFSAKPYMV